MLGKRYECKFDPVACQKPGKFLMEDACVEVVKEEIKNAMYNHNDDGTISIELRVYGDKKLCFELHCANIPEEQKSEEPYEVVNMVKYPTWHSYEEFEKLRENKYVLESLNWKNFFTIGNNYMVLGEWRGLSSTCDNMASADTYKQNLPGHGCEMRNLLKCSNLDSLACGMLSPMDGDLDTMFKHSVDVEYYGNRERICYYLIYWIQYHYVGFALKNYKETIDRKLLLEIIINGKNCNVIIKRSKQKFLTAKFDGNVRKWNIMQQNPRIVINGLEIEV